MVGGAGQWQLWSQTATNNSRVKEGGKPPRSAGKASANGEQLIQANACRVGEAVARGSGDVVTGWASPDHV